MLVIDTSGSMLATDVQARSAWRPRRRRAARSSTRCPDEFRVGVVDFGSSAEQRRRADHRPPDACAPRSTRCRSRAATAMGDGLKLGLDAARTPFPNGLGGVRRLPAAIVLLSDGAQTRGQNDPIEIARPGKKFKVPIYTVALGTPTGSSRRRPERRDQASVPPDRLTLQEIAERHRRPVLQPPNAAQLEAVYRNLGTRLADVHGEARGHGGVRRRRAGAAARRRCGSRSCARGGCREPAAASARRRAPAGPARAPGPSRPRCCARSTSR